MDRKVDTKLVEISRPDRLNVDIKRNVVKFDLINRDLYRVGGGSSRCPRQVNM